MKRPAFQFYPADWVKDLQVRSCSIAARALWFEMLCMAHESERYGHLVLNGKPMTDAEVVGNVRGATRKMLVELEAKGVFSRDADGSIYSRRMVKDERLRAIRAKAGKLGGNPVLVNQEDNHEVNPKVRPKVAQVRKQKPTPSSSSSSSVEEKAKPSSAAPPGLPVSPELWEEFRRMRKSLKDGALTDYGEGLLVKELIGIAAAGHDPTATVEQSIKRNWKGFFPVDSQGKKAPTLAERRAANIDDITGRARNERTVNADPVGGAPVLPVLRDLRQQDDDDVGGLPKG